MKKSFLNTEQPEILDSEFRRFDSTPWIPLMLGTLLYFAWFIFFVGLRTEHIGLYIFALGLYFSHPQTRKFILAFSIFIVYWIMYDSMRVVPNYKVNPIHIDEIYNFEKAWFGVNTVATDSYGKEIRLTLNEYFRAHHISFLDVMSGIFYLNWVPIPLIFSFWLLKNNKELFLKFSYAFVFTNVVGFGLYYCYPAAPPWYIEQYGFNIIHGTPGNAAGLLNFDQFFGIHLFEGMYAKNANVFAAMPSLHSAYPVLCFLYGRKLKLTALNIFFLIFVIGIWFAAVYTRHHYLIDVLMGGTVAITCYFVFEYLSEKTRLKNWFDFIINKI